MLSRVLRALALLLSSNAAIAQVSGHVSLLSDYRSRGEALTDGRPAVQAGLAYDDASGIFLGALASNVRIDPTATGLSAEIYGGYARSFGEHKSWEIGANTYLFPRPLIPPDYDYSEVFIGTSVNRLSARLYYSTNYFRSGAHAIYSELNTEQPLTERLALLGHIGYLQTASPGHTASVERGGSQLDFLAGIGWNVSSYEFEFGVVGTASRHEPCPAGTGRCNSTAVVLVSRLFK
jgi:uncharacterized protein (TIGR02001 family)